MNAFLLKTKDPFGDTYSTAAGFKVKQETIAHGALALTASGVFTGRVAEHHIKGLALNGDTPELELSFDTGERVRAKFSIYLLEYAGDFNGERNYTIELRSIGEVERLQ